jgi:hypothetical protein
MVSNVVLKQLAKGTGHHNKLISILSTFICSISILCNKVFSYLNDEQQSTCSTDLLTAHQQQGCEDNLALYIC